MKKTTRKQLRTIRRRRLALALVGAMAMPAALAQSLPSGYTVVNGDPTIGSVGTDDIDADHEGRDHRLGQHQHRRGLRGDVRPAVQGEQRDLEPGGGLRILDQACPQIDRTLTSNGNVFIINPAGITFGNNAQVNVGGIVASFRWTCRTRDFLAGLTSGQYRFIGNGGAPARSTTPARSPRPIAARSA